MQTLQGHGGKPGTECWTGTSGINWKDEKKNQWKGQGEEHSFEWHEDKP